MTSANRIRHLDGIRGLAILAVLLHHWAGLQTTRAQGGYIGVDLFFVLSGYIITTLLLKKRLTYKKFIARRARRLYPPLAGLLIGGTALAWLLPGSMQVPAEVLQNAAIAAVQGSSIVMASGGHMNPFTPTWTLSVEWMFYLAWPFALIRIARLRPSRAALTCAASATLLYASSLGLSAQWFYFGPISRSAELIAGAALAFAFTTTWLTQATPATRRVINMAASAAIPFIVLWSVFGPGPLSGEYRTIGFPITAVGAAALITAGGTHGTFANRVLTFRPLVAVGLVSYSLYLWHVFPFSLLGAHWLGLPTVTVAIIGVVMAAMATAVGYMLLERPFVAPARRSPPLGGERSELGDDLGDAGRPVAVRT